MHKLRLILHRVFRAVMLLERLEYAPKAPAPERWLGGLSEHLLRKPNSLPHASIVSRYLVWTEAAAAELAGCLTTLLPEPATLQIVEYDRYRLRWLVVECSVPGRVTPAVVDAWARKIRIAYESVRFELHSITVRQYGSGPEDPPWEPTEAWVPPAGVA
jgi:hypothetical protein